MDPQGYDAGKKVTGRKRHILVDTLGLLLSVAVHSADIQSTVKNAISRYGGFDRGRKGGAGVEGGEESGQYQAQ